MTRTLTLLLLTGALATAAVADSRGTARAAEPSAPVVYATGGTGAGRLDSEIAVRLPDGTVRRLTENRLFDGFPRWSPDRTKIVFVRAVRDDADVYVMNADGTNVRRLAGSARRAQDLYPTWSPDGRLIAFASNRYGENEILVMRADGTGLRRVTRTPRHVDDTQPVFTPDGRSLVIASNRVAFSNYELYRIRLADGKVLKRLTFWGKGGDLTPGDDLMPDVSPDGKRIAWVSDRDGSYALWTMDANGRNVRRAARNPGRNAAFPRFSPDGRTLLYGTFRFDSGPPREFTLRTVPAGGGSPATLAPGTEADW